MNDGFQPETVQAVQALCDVDADAKKLFEWTASLKNDAEETSVERLMSAVGISRISAVTLAKKLETAGCGRFVVGRKGARSRFKWAYSRVSLGKVAARETEEIEPVSTNLATDAEDDAALLDVKPLTIASAKELLALSLGVRSEQIEITVKG